ncbi:LysR family transcriptional regulator [Chania multitudinisentens RB-25]|uniref:LysR family transcriptional regulator n=1 Tax=Chania multitudinisentens RB-25 TaxID=1441930 RepID=W0L8C0_9GAMM|nr:LysR family transcriptional regulator [Chania multitudinisentens]AHG18639.1 LysR family transcriptional regulator [Chania multitudinisentens RB-25]
MDSLSALNAFVQAAETRNFTVAGQRLGLSPSAIGKAITRLENKLGVRLFHRSTRAITLTPEGSCFLERCRRILCELEVAEQELMHAKDAPRGLLRVSMPLAGMLMMPTLSAFMRHYPEITLDIDFSDRFVDVIEEGFDAVVRAGNVSDSRLMSRVLGKFELQLVASPDYLAQQGVPEKPADLQQYVCLHHRFATSGKLEPWPLKPVNGASPELPVSMVVNTIEPLIYMVEQGQGIACLPDFAVRRQLACGSLVQVLASHTQHSGIFRLLWPSSRYLSPKLRVFVDFLSENLFPRA